jgi:hypothetical protein
LEGNLLKPRNPYLQPTDQLADQATNQPATDELNYSHHMAQRHQCPTKNLLEVWQNLAIFGSRPIGAAVEVLLTKVVNQ